MDKLVLRSNSGGAGDSHYLFIDNYPTSRDLGISSQLQFIDYCDQRNLVIELLMHIVAKKMRLYFIYRKVASSNTSYLEAGFTNLIQQSLKPGCSYF